MTTFLSVFSITIAICAASVDFTFSTLYDIYDFVGKEEVHIARCDNGCLIFASTLLDGFNSTTGYDPYADNLFIHDNNQDRNFSITDLSRQFNETTSEKTPLTIWGPASISILNLNLPTDASWQIVIYVIERTKASEFSYAVYDALNMRGIMVNLNGIVTVMSADPFTLSSLRRGSENGLVARLVGFENVRDGNGDSCPRAFYMPSQNPFPGFNLNVNGPIISLLFNERNTEVLDAKRGLVNLRALSDNGFITSPGYNGCKKPLSGGVQSFRSPFYEPTASFLLSSIKDMYHVSVDVEPDLDAKHRVIVNDVTNGQPITITDFKTVSFDFDMTKYVEVAFENLEGDQGFLMRHTATVALETTTSTTKMTTASSTTSPIGSTTSSHSLTTSGTLDLHSFLIFAIAVLTAARIV